MGSIEALLDTLFPFHFVVDEGLIVTHTGRAMARALSGLLGSPLHERLRLVRPDGPLDFAGLLAHQNAVVLLENPCRGLLLRGQFVALDGGSRLLFAGSPWLTSPSDIARFGLESTDFAVHDPALDLLAEMQARQRSLDEARLLTARLEVERRRVEEATRAKSEFVSTMSHELRTPLNAILGVSGLLLHSRLDPRQAEYVDTIRTSGTLLLDLINNILDFSKIESRRLELEALPFDLLSCVEDCVEVFVSTARGKGLRLTHQVDPELPRMVCGDITRLRQVLVNLVGNATKFTHQGYVHLDVSAAPEGRVRFRVADTGVGVPEDRREAIFEPFLQADASSTRQYGGTGLGLTISARLVRLMGGVLDLESEINEGSVFSFEIPLPAATGEEPEARLTTHTVLLVESEVSRALSVQTALEQEGAWVVWARSMDHVLAMELGSPTSVVLGREMIANLGALRARYPDSTFVIACDGASGLQPKDEDDVPTGACEACDSATRAACGGVVTLRRPVRRDALVRALTCSESDGRRSALPSKPPLAGLRILVAEDNPTNQRVIQWMLGSFGYEPDIVADGREAVEAVTRRNYDLILMDVQMPHLDGLEATRWIRHSPSGQHARILGITANAERGDRERCLEAGMDGYLPKPVRLEDLESALREIGHAVVRERRASGVHSVVSDAVEAAELPPIDPAQIAALAMPLAIFQKVFAGFLEDAVRLVKAMRAAAEAHDVAGVKARAHSLAGSSANVGARRVEALSREIEALGSVPAEGMVARLEAELVVAHQAFDVYARGLG